MKSSATSTEIPHVAAVSARALASIAAETLQHGGNETGGLLLGHRCGPIWFIVESVDPGPVSTHSPAHFTYDQAYLNHLINKLRWYYHKPLSLLGLWHRHPGSFDRFSAPDKATNRRFLAEYPEGVLSALVNLDPTMRMTVYAVSKNQERPLPFSSGDAFFPPALLAYRAAKSPPPPTLRLLCGALAKFAGALEPQGRHESSLERLIELSEEDIAFLAPLCGKLTMKTDPDGALALEEGGSLLLRLAGDGSSALLAVGGTVCRYRPGLIGQAVTDYLLCGKGHRLL